MNKPFSIRESLWFGWDKVRNNSAVVFQVVLSVLAIQVVSAIVEKSLSGTALGAVVSAVLTVLSIFVAAGTTLISLKLARGEGVHYSEIIPDFRLVLKFLLSSILSTILVLAPLAVAGIIGIILFGSSIGGAPVSTPEQFLALVSPGIIGVVFVFGLIGLFCAIYLGMRLSVVRFAILDGVGVVESLRKSRTLTQGHTGRLLLFCIVIVALNVLGLVALFVGLLLTLPVSLIAFAHVYDKLKSR